jgi:CheY-like chemotaxis protein
MKPPKIETILIVDDDLDDRSTFCDAVIEVDGELSCLMATSGLEAFELLQHPGSRLPDLIFLDLNMPKQNGKVFLTRLKKLNNLSHIPVIIYSTSKLQKDIDECSRLGAIHFLTKPNSFNDLKTALRNILSSNLHVNIYPEQS